MTRTRFVAGAFLMVALCVPSGSQAGEGASSTPKPVPATRPEVKRALEALKERTPRLPLPPPTDEERANAGQFGLVNNLRMRKRYLPEAWISTRGGFGQDPAMTIERVFKTQCFWIVSRVNNCQYCLGHQEFSLGTMQGLSDSRIASLDADWSIFLPKEQAAFGLARKLTMEPHRMGDEDVEKLREHFEDREIVELIYTIANFNSTNRWTDSLGIPQDQGFREVKVRFDRPTEERFLTAASLNAPLDDLRRPPLESRQQVEAAISACRARKARVALASDEQARQILPAQWSGPAPQWVCALALFPQTGGAQVAHRLALEEEGRLDKLLKAQIAWTSARANRAWYALGDARRRLGELGVAAAAAYELDEPGESLSPAVREALAFAAKLTAAPHTIADADVARLREHFSDHETAEIVYVTCHANMFDRFTEALGLALEE